MRRLARQQTGAALVLVLLGVLIFSALSAFIILAVDRHTDLRVAFQKSVAGFNAAEAGIHVGAVNVLNAMQGFSLPSNCGVAGTSFPLNNRTVTYKLSVPTNPPYNGVAGSCAETPLTTTEPQAKPFAGLNALLYTYDLVSTATNALGFNEATINNQFQAHLIPMFQFAAFYANDLEYLPGPPLVVNGRLHTNKNMYLNSDSCGAAIGNGMNILGPLTAAGSLYRGRKDTSVNWDNVYLSLDGTSSTMQVLGTNSVGSTSCAQAPTRLIGQAEINSFNSPGQARITTGIQNITLPTAANTLCVPWIAGCPSATGGTYWQAASLRLVLDTTTTQRLNPGSGIGPALYPIRVLNQDGSVNFAKTNSLGTFMFNAPGAISYSDVPTNWNCSTGPACEANAYAQYSGYSTAFPRDDTNGCKANRDPRNQITAANYCYDYRYGGFYNWREGKPILMLNIDWMALEEWNKNNGGPLFTPSTTAGGDTGAITTGGLVVFVSIKDTVATEGYKANNLGVRIYDAARARYGSTDPGVTFATDQAMYIAGNFNCPRPVYDGSDASPAACGDTAWPPIGSSTFQKPTSVVADTVNVLSCNWIQQQPGGTSAPCGAYTMGQDQWASGCGVGCRPVDEASTMRSGTTPVGASCGGSGCQAKESIINTAFLAGVDQTWCPSPPSGVNCGTSYYSGGLENYPRFHEDWSGTDASTGRARKFWYQGSFVAIGTPFHTCFEYAAQVISGVAVANDPAYACAGYPQGFWTSQRYSPPQRRWFYDVSFNDASRLPPLTPRFVYLSLAYFTEVFR